MTDPREEERERIRKAMEDLVGSGLSLYKLALLLEQPYNTVKHWRATGSVESYYAGRIDQLVRVQMPNAWGVCQLTPQTCYCEISHIATCTSP